MTFMTFLTTLLSPSKFSSAFKFPMMHHEAKKVDDNGEGDSKGLTGHEGHERKFSIIGLLPVHQITANLM